MTEDFAAKKEGGDESSALEMMPSEDGEKHHSNSDDHAQGEGEKEDPPKAPHFEDPNKMPSSGKEKGGDGDGGDDAREGGPASPAGIPVESKTRDKSVKIIPFCVQLPSSSSILDAFAEETPPPSSHVDSGFGVVGTVTLRGRSAVVWFGWGAIEPGEAGALVGECADGLVAVGTGRPPMGSLALSMPPPAIRNGRPATNRLGGAATSQLLGGSSDEDMILGHQISARLTKRVGWPVFVSCSFSGWTGDVSGGGSSDLMVSPASSAGYDESMQRHAAALAEREVSRILLHEKGTA